MRSLGIQSIIDLLNYDDLQVLANTGECLTSIAEDGIYVLVFHSS